MPTLQSVSGFPYLTLSCWYKMCIIWKWICRMLQQGHLVVIGNAKSFFHLTKQEIKFAIVNAVTVESVCNNLLDCFLVGLHGFQHFNSRHHFGVAHSPSTFAGSALVRSHSKAVSFSL